MKDLTTLGDRIAYYRRLHAMTQEELAKQLNVSTQAVSKWEWKVTSPDIILLPAIADCFCISIDELFGKETHTEPVFELVDHVPWNDDDRIRIAVYHGKKLMQHSENVLSNGCNTIHVHFNYGDQYKLNGICKLNKQTGYELL